MASSTRLSFRPIRKSPVMILTTYFASHGGTLESSLRVSPALSAGLLKEEISRKRFWVSVGKWGLSSSCGDEGRTASATAPKSPWLRYDSVSSASDFPDNSATMRHKIEPPTCKVVSSQAGKGLPEKKTAPVAAS